MSREIVVRKNGDAVQAGADGTGDMMKRLKDLSERSLYVFAKAILGWNLLTSHFHRPLCDDVQTVPPRQKGYLLPRDHFKTTIAKSLVIHMTIQKPESNLYISGLPGVETRILYCCKTTDRAETRIRAIKETYERNQLLRAFWPEVMWDDPSAAKAKWNQERLLLRRAGTFDECTIERTGVDSAITGGHFDAFIKDDLIDLKDRNEPTTMLSAINWNHSSYSLANDPATVLEWYFGTHWGAYDLYTDVEETDPYNPETLEGVKWMKRAVIENGVPIFPERFPLKEIERRKRIDEDLFYLNYMNTIVGSKMQDFNMDLIRDFEIRGNEVIYKELAEDNDLQRLFEGDGTAVEDGDELAYARRIRHTIYKVT